jgi:hypothetical protein
MLASRKSGHPLSKPDPLTYIRDAGLPDMAINER